MESALIVSSAEKSTESLTKLLIKASISNVTTVQSCAEARRQLMDNTVDLVVINAPLSDESGELLAKDITMQGNSIVILIVNAELFEAVSFACEECGVLTISKPINGNLFWSALQLAKSAHRKTQNIYTENSKLKQKIENIRIVDRAKYVLISHLNMSEPDAHHHIEKTAMDMRSSKRKVAEDILKTYDN